MSLKVEVEFSPAFQTRLALERQTLLLEEDRSTIKDLFDLVLSSCKNNISAVNPCPGGMDIGTVHYS